MKMNFERRRAARKLVVAAIGLAVCANGCAYFSAQPEVYPDKFAPQESDRAWIPKIERICDSDAGAARQHAARAARDSGRQQVRPARADRYRAQQQSRHAADVGAGAGGGGGLRSVARAVLSGRECAGAGWIRARAVRVAGTKRRAQAMADDAGTRVHLHADRLRPPRRRRRRRARATGGGELFVQPQAAGCGVRDAARVLFDRRGQGGGEGGGAKRRAGEDRRRGRQPPRRSRAGDSARAAAVAPARRAIAIRSRQRASAGARGAGEHGGRAGSRGQRGVRRADARQPADSRQSWPRQWIN